MPDPEDPDWPEIERLVNLLAIAKNQHLFFDGQPDRYGALSSEDTLHLVWRLEARLTLLANRRSAFYRWLELGE
jgi:hypothetical protein